MKHNLKTLLKLLKDDPNAPRWVCKEYCEALMKELQEIKSLIDTATAWYDLSESTLVEELLGIERKAAE